VRYRVFCSSLADVFDNEVPIEWLAELLDIIRSTPNLDWLVLTKRIGNFKSRINAVIDHLKGVSTGDTATALKTYGLLAWISDWSSGKPPTNVWLGITVVNQQEADRDIQKLLEIPARVRWLSMEPLLESVSLRWLSAWPENFPAIAQKPGGSTHHLDGLRRLDWVVVGGESGSNARPMHPDWARSLRDQCVSAGVKFLFKQWGEYKPVCAQYPRNEAEHEEAEDASLCGDICVGLDGCIWEEGVQPNGYPWLMDKTGKKKAGRELDGRTWDEYPE
jgi:protein gp37